MNYKLILSLIMIGTVVLFVIQNDTTVELTSLSWTLLMSRASEMLLFLSNGIVLGGFASQLRQYKKNHPDAISL